MNPTADMQEPRSPGVREVADAVDAVEAGGGQ